MSVITSEEVGINRSVELVLMLLLSKSSLEKTPTLASALVGTTPVISRETASAMPAKAFLYSLVAIFFTNAE